MSDGAHPALQHHFQDMNVQRNAARLGMWLFLATEVLLFGGLFVGYMLFRWHYSAGFSAASHHLDQPLGLVNTFVLITSSFTMAMAVHAGAVSKGKQAAVLIFVTIGFALAFLVIHGFEYAHEVHLGELPGSHFHRAGVVVRGESMFFTLYFLMTGLHSLHVLIGAGVLTWIMIRAWRNEFSAEYNNPLELAGLYWHLVDLIWIFLFPLLYLIA
jgi:cytochrome c oxidase subunit 3